MICSLGFDFGWFGGIFGTELDSELKEAIFVGRTGSPQNQGFEIPNVLVLMRDNYG